MTFINFVTTMKQNPLSFDLPSDEEEEEDHRKALKSTFRFPVFGLSPMTSTILLLAENMVPKKYRRTPFGESPIMEPDYLFGGGGSNKKLRFSEINFEYVVWHHIDLTVKYVIASFLENDTQKNELVAKLVKQFEEWNFVPFRSVYHGKIHADMKSDKLADPIKFWKKLIKDHTLAAKAIADNTWQVGNYSRKLKGLLTILGENRTQIGKYLTGLTKSTEAQKLWDAHLICTSDYISALHLTQDHNGPTFGKAVFVCKLLGLELGGFLNKIAYNK